jgi:hypothetical protein
MAIYMQNLCRHAELASASDYGFSAAWGFQV